MNGDIQQVLGQVKEALGKATAGPWKVYRKQNENETLIGTAYDHPQLKGPDGIVNHAYGVTGEFVYIKDENAHLIANSPTWLQALVTELEEAQTEIANKEETNSHLHLEVNYWQDEYQSLKGRFEELDKSADEALDLLKDFSRTIADKDRENEKLRKALRIYADENHYVSTIGSMEITPTSMIDKGQIARMALSPKEEVNQDV
ncbi:hypothetical protein [Paenibacillus sp. L3-i20]|uniref:hypothetical protein n=1 Tax=Paenibacillus sp. L3-i20 TaxID=2905833 RepID=UPI001EDF16FE|nr:hypothetical protein [Paenibacillus sp. L3-i20]GKU76881.1 hypothetical protein L3i20_v212780 [Paenibacillus sp. L3-i20]